MKFGKYLASRQLELPEYSGHFINYKALKKMIKQLAAPATGDKPLSQADIERILKENNASFFFKVERELEKVNSFYLEKQSNLCITLDLLLVAKHDLFSNVKRLYDKNAQFEAEYLNFKNSITFLNLYQNFKKIHHDLMRLQQFILLNETGFLKVVKKWDKRSKSHTRELFILTAVNVQPVFHKDEINELSDLVTSSLFDLESIIDGDLTPLKTFSLDKHPRSSFQSFHGNNQQPTTSTEPGYKRHASIVEFFNNEENTSLNVEIIQNKEIDELYSSFVNIATIKEPELDLLDRWIDKVNDNMSEDNPELSRNVKLKYSRILLLAITNLKVSDDFLKLFLERINYNIDVTLVSNSFNNNKNLLHECCSIPAASTPESNEIINNGVKVVRSNDLISHSRLFIVKRVLEQSNSEDLKALLIAKDFNGRNCLHYASQNNRIDLLDILLQFFPREHLDDLDNESMSPLLLAIKHKHFEAIKRMVESGCEVYPEMNDEKLQYLPVNFACKTGDYETVKYLLTSSQNEGINAQDVEGLLPLHVAARSGHHFLVELLVDNGSDINLIDSLNKWPPIFYAASEGNLKTTQELLKFGAKVDLVDEDGYNVLYYCVIEGHISCLNELFRYYPIINKNESEALTSMLVDAKRLKVNKGVHNKDQTILNDDRDSGEEDEAKNIDTIPDLQLPPPILPLRRYGHNFLEQKVLIELVFPNNGSFISLFNSSTDMKAGRITLSSNNSDIIPRNIILPAADESKIDNCIFQTDVDSLSEFRIDFEIFPKFGTRLIAKTTVLAFSQINTSSPEVSSISLPLFDLRLKNIGEIRFNCQVIFPFGGTLLEASKFDTYWKSSTSFIKKGVQNPTSLSPHSYLSPSNIASTIGDAPTITGGAVTSTNELVSGTTSTSFVTATSLSGKYLRLKVCLLNDATPIVCPSWSISITDSIDLYLPNLSMEQLASVTDNLFDYEKVLQDLSSMTANDITLIKKLLKIIYLPLEVVLEVLNVDINLDIEIVFPSEYEIRNLPFVANVSLMLNNFIDFTLNDIFNHLRALRANNKTNRSIIFMSSNSLICKILNWKQPNFPVFLSMSGISFNPETKMFEERTTNGFLLDDESSSDEPSFDSFENDAYIHERNSNPDKLIEIAQEQTSKSIKDAVGFAVSNNLIGLITSIHLLRLVPKLIPLIRSRGLILVATNESHESDSSKELDTYTKTEINGIRSDDVLTFKDDITM